MLQMFLSASLMRRPPVCSRSNEISTDLVSAMLLTEAEDETKVKQTDNWKCLQWMAWTTGPLADTLD